jgi:hypothetical protein
MARATSVARRDPLMILGDVEIGFVERERLDQIGIFGEDARIWCDTSR